MTAFFSLESLHTDLPANRQASKQAIKPGKKGNLRMFKAALLVLYGSSTLASGFSPPMPPATVALIDPQIEDEFTMTLVLFFMNRAKKCFVTRNGPTTFAVRTKV